MRSRGEEAEKEEVVGEVLKRGVRKSEGEKKRVVMAWRRKREGDVEEERRKWRRGGGGDGEGLGG